MSLPQNLPLNLMQTYWANLLNPLLALPITQGMQITGITFSATSSPALTVVISVKLGRQMLGWFLTDNTANANVWRTGSLNANTLTLVASAATTISIWVF